MYNDNNKLQTALSCSVQLNILELQKKGGPSEADLDFCHKMAQVIGGHGDILLWKGSKKNNYPEIFNGKKITTADMFNSTSKAIAIMSFSPGGVEIFGLKFNGSKKVKSWK